MQDARRPGTAPGAPRRPFAAQLKPQQPLASPARRSAACCRPLRHRRRGWPRLQTPWRPHRAPRNSSLRRNTGACGAFAGLKGAVGVAWVVCSWWGEGGGAPQASRPQQRPALCCAVLGLPTSASGRFCCCPAALEAPTQCPPAPVAISTPAGRGAAPHTEASESLMHILHGAGPLAAGSSPGPNQISPICRLASSIATDESRAALPHQAASIKTIASTQHGLTCGCRKGWERGLNTVSRSCWQAPLPPRGFCGASFTGRHVHRCGT